MNTDSNLFKDSDGWVFFVKASFVLAATAMLVGIWLVPTDWWIKGYLLMGELYLIGATITLSKTVRDQHEHRRLYNKITQARTERMLSEFDKE